VRLMDDGRDVFAFELREATRETVDDRMHGLLFIRSCHAASLRVGRPGDQEPFTRLTACVSAPIFL
jgi:hypothetical protein